MRERRLKTKAVGWIGFGPGMSRVDLPAGLAVVRCPESYTCPPEDRRWFVDEFPEETFPTHSMERHDAIHYGIRLTREQLQEVDENEEV